MSIYLDTSVLIPTLVKEAASDAVEASLTRGQERLISDFAAVEVASVLSRFVRTGQLHAAEAVARLADFETWRAATSLPADLRAADARLAYAYVRRFELMLRAPDALHLAIANRLEATLVTLDRRMERAAQELGIAVEVPRTR
jgi:predicted nucleic acid-binding protein